MLCFTTHIHDAACCVQEKSTKSVMEVRRQVDVYREKYDILVVEDKLLDKSFKKEFHEASAVQLDHLYKMFRKRPRSVLHTYQSVRNTTIVWEIKTINWLKNHWYDDEFYYRVAKDTLLSWSLIFYWCRSAINLDYYGVDFSFDWQFQWWMNKIKNLMNVSMKIKIQAENYVLIYYTHSCNFIYKTIVFTAILYLNGYASVIHGLFTSVVDLGVTPLVDLGLPNSNIYFYLLNEIVCLFMQRRILSIYIYSKRFDASSCKESYWLYFCISLISFCKF